MLLIDSTLTDKSTSYTLSEPKAAMIGWSSRVGPVPKLPSHGILQKPCRSDLETALQLLDRLSPASKGAVVVSVCCRLGAEEAWLDCLAAVGCGVASS